MNMKPDKMADLVNRIVTHRDKGAYAQLFNHFAPRLNGYLYRLGLDNEQAEELVQEVMLILWHKGMLFDPGKSTLSTWLYRIARNRRIDRLRKEKSGKLDPNEPMLLPSEVTPPDQEYDIELRASRIRLAIKSLPVEQYEVIRLAFFEGYSHSQITKKTGLPVGTVKSRIRLAMTKLKRIFEEDEMVDTDLA